MLKSGNKYLCKVTAPINGWFGEAGEKNTPYIRLPLTVTEDGDAEGDEIVWQGWLTEKSFDRTIKTLADVFGWDGDIEALAKMMKTGPFVGKPCQIVTDEEEYNGKKRVIIKWLNRADGGGKAMADGKAMAFAQRFGARAKAAAARAGEPPNPPPPRPSVFAKPPTDPDLDAPEDDIPF